MDTHLIVTVHKVEHVVIKYTFRKVVFITLTNENILYQLQHASA
jgi:hypothetical protein